MTRSLFDSLSPNLPDATVPLTEYGIVEVHGKDAGRFLQGQVSCNMEEVTEQTNQAGTANTAKGRIYSFFRIAQQSDDSYLLRMPKTMIPLFESILSKYCAFFKAQIQVETQWQVSGIMSRTHLSLIAPDIEDCFGQEINQTWSDKNTLLLPSLDHSNRFECWHKKPLSASFESYSYSDADWRWLDMLSGIPELCPSISEVFIPQMLNLDKWNAIHFQKGCYTGQEIIARMRYLGKLKKRMRLFQSENKVYSEPGSWLVDKKQQKSAQVVRYQQSQSGLTLIQAVAPIELDTEENPTYIPGEIATTLTLISAGKESL